MGSSFIPIMLHVTVKELILDIKFNTTVEQKRKLIQNINKLFNKFFI